MPPLPPPPDPAPIAAPAPPRGSSDSDCLSAAVYYEARGESEAGQAAVAQVVLNRLARPSFPKSVCGVVYQRLAGGGCQFSFVCDGAMRRPLEPAAWQRARRIAERALAGERASAVGEATSFHAVWLGDVWGPRMIQVAKIGGHDFYTPAAGAAGRR
ncbi:MAG: cell wall hydrolase, partial [Caulobacteraceae bacterium]